MAVFPLGIGLAAVEMRSPVVAGAVPFAVGAVVLMAGVLQFTAWKARYLACCRKARGRGPQVARPTPGTAWRHGLRLGGPLRLMLCRPDLDPAGVGVMDLRAMAVRGGQR